MRAAAALALALGLCAAEEGDGDGCACVDDAGWSSPDGWGTCSDYRVGGVNEGYCDDDAAAVPCALSCGACPDCSGGGGGEARCGPPLWPTARPSADPCRSRCLPVPLGNTPPRSNVP